MQHKETEIHYATLGKQKYIMQNSENRNILCNIRKTEIYYATLEKQKSIMQH